MVATLSRKVRRPTILLFKVYQKRYTMKKLLYILFVGVLPFLGFGQDNPIVSWNGRLINNTPSFKPTYLNSSTDAGISSAALSAQDISSTGVSPLAVVSWESFLSTGWPTGQNVDSGKYFSLTVSPKANYQLALNKLVLKYKGNNKKMRVSYSKNANFSNPTDIYFTDLNFYNTPTLVNVNFPTTVNVTSSETLYIRIYGYDSNGDPGNGNSGNRSWALQFDVNNPSSNVGPTLYGTVTNTSSPQVPIANADAVSTLKNLASTINILANDIHGTISAITVTQLPTNGTIQVNGLDNITYTPNINFVGNDTFKYKLVDNIGTSNIAKVSIAVNQPTVTALVRWDGANLQPNPFLISPNISSDAITSSGNVGFQTLNWGNPNAFHTSEWPTDDEPDYSKYVQFTISANSGYQIDLSQFNFNYQVDSNSGPSKFQVRYSTSPSFPSNGTLIYTNSNLTKGEIVSESILLTGLTVTSNQTLYIRIYAYARPEGWSAPFRFQHSYNSSNPSQNNPIGPTIFGIVYAKPADPVTTWNGTNAGWSNGTPTITKDALIAADYQIATNETLTVKNLTINPTGKINVASNGVLLVQNNVVVLSTDGSVAAQLIVENNGSFVQVDDNSTYTGSPTSFVSKRITQPVTRYDFTYWSSPVENFILKEVSPTTLFDKFFSWNSSTQSWTVHKSNAADLEVMAAGRGYTVRAPQSFSLTNPDTRQTEFKGKPNNGVQKVVVSNNAVDRWNLIGNPYASAISVAEFLEVNKDVLEGTLYFWTHKTAAAPSSGNSSYYSYSNTDYVAVNLSGNVENGTTIGTVDAAPGGNSLGVTPGSDFLNIASGQSFFIKGKVAGAIGTQATFNNAMRVQTGKSNSQFFRPGITTPADNWATTGKHRVWLNITSTQNDFNQALVGYIENATNDLDWGYDGEVFSSGAVTLYSLSNEKTLTIQGRALPFSNQDEVPLGYKTTRTGTLKISIDHVDGLFEGQDVYIKDNVLNIVHNLKDSEYSFTTVPGTFNNRFVLLYVPQENLGTETPVLDAKSVLVFNTNNQISVKSTNEMIDQVLIYDLQGRVLYSKNNVNAQEFTTQSLSANNQVVVVKIIAENKAEVVKKIILN